MADENANSLPEVTKSYNGPVPQDVAAVPHVEIKAGYNGQPQAAPINELRAVTPPPPKKGT
ncbi:MAG: hypothetical protein ABJZ55_22380 [Fuerstiella sp.]